MISHRLFSHRYRALLVINSGFCGNAWPPEQCLQEKYVTAHFGLRRAIGTRMWRMRRQCFAAVSGSESRMSGLLAMLCESAALYTMAGMGYAALMLQSRPTMEATLVMSALFQILAFHNPSVIILRVAMGISFDDYITVHQRKFIIIGMSDKECVSPRNDLPNTPEQ
jgi:hypothetical protein